MQPFKHSFIGVALVLLAVATYVVLAGHEPASPATTGEVTPISCLSQVHECVTATLGQMLMSQRSQHGVSFGQDASPIHNMARNGLIFVDLNRVAAHVAHGGQICAKES